VADIQQNLATIRDKIAKAAGRAGRNPSQITLMAVTKNVPAEAIAEARRAGVLHMGENRVQEAAEKRQELTHKHPACADIPWHMIGHLQSNKSKKAVDLFHSVDSVDSFALAERLDRDAAAAGRLLPCLVEVNIGGEASKSGMAPSELPPFLDQAAALKNVTIEGLMVIPPRAAGPEAARPFFAKARALFEKNKFQTETPVLSMGMSGDFEVAIEEGSTLVRIGTALFGARPRAQ
jgi:pyridoxal phosphate enzyme (YggS family)